MSAATLPSVHHIDHITYVAEHGDEQEFTRRWKEMGFRHHVRIETTISQASHIALTSGARPGAPWAVMTGLSISPDARSPINEFIRRYGEGPQHVAYAIDPAVELEDVVAAMERAGTAFMTRVLTYRDPATGAALRQAFTAPARPYGTFVELVQRFAGGDGHPFDAFDTENIEQLYAAYDSYSRWLESSSQTPRPAVSR